MNTEKTRYSDSELAEFKEVILEKLRTTREALRVSLSILSSDHGYNNKLGDGAVTLEREQASQSAGREQKFIQELEAALVRIENKTYGICRQTGKLIQKERLIAVPHTTLCIEAKLAAA